MKFYFYRVGGINITPLKKSLLFPKKLLTIFKANKGQIIMRINLIIFFLSFLLMQVNAETYAQRITFKGKKVSLETVLTEVTRQTGIDILCDGQLVSQSQAVDVNFKKASLKEIFSTFFPESSFNFLTRNNTIVVSRDDDISIIEEARKLMPIDISGKVTDQQGISLPGATVKVKNSSQAVSTGLNGEFRLDGI